MTYLCIGVPYALGQFKTESSIEALKASGIAEELGAAWVDLQPDFAVYENPVVAVNRALAEVIAAHPDETPLIFAQDCTSVWGALKGLAAQSPAILWYDAHGDFNTPETSPSGYLGGMPLAAVVGRGNQALIQAIGTPLVNEGDVLISDARDLDPQEGINLRASRLTLLPKMDDLLTAALPTKPLYIHMDVDVIDPTEIPAQNYPAPNGPSTEQTAATLRRIVRDAKIAGVLFSLWDQSLPGADLAQTNMLKLVRALVD